MPRIENMEREIISADRALRVKALIGIFLLSLAGVVLISATASYVNEIKLIADIDPELALNKIKKLLILTAVVNAAATIPLGFYFIRLASKILKHHRYPPKGMRVIRDTRVRTGKKATSLARSCFFISALVLSTNFIFLYFYYILISLIKG